jgi:glycosyltransferase involved in cell wall biosynthesis
VHALRERCNVAATGERVGIVVIGRNEGERLRICLQSTSNGCAIVYVDSNSTDGSVELARQYAADVVPLDMTRSFTAARARNVGARRLLQLYPALQYVQFVDGDCELESTWLDTAASFLDNHPRVAVVCGRRRERYRDATFYNRLCDQEWDTPIGRSLACGGDAMIRISALLEVDFYDDAIVAGEEPELCSRMRARGWGIWRLAAPMTVHDAAMHSFHQWWRRAVRGGFGYAQVWHKTTRSSSSAVYGRELARAVGWTLGVPLLAILLAAFFGPIGLLAVPAVWLAQFFQLSSRHGIAQAAHLLVGKAAECAGALIYATGVVSGRDYRPAGYK